MNGLFKLKPEFQFFSNCSFRQVDCQKQNTKLKIDILGVSMEKIALSPPLNVDEDFRFYVMYGATNVVAPMAALNVIGGIIEAHHLFFGLSPGIVMYFGMPVSLIVIAAVLIMSFWLIIRFRKHRKLLLATLFANIAAVALTGGPSFLLSLVEIPSFTMTYIKLIGR